jgi:DNA replication and repair protein RecF
MSGVKLLRLKVDNFRNLTNDVVEFIGGINCIFGPNGNGKTNLLEAVYLITNRKSFRKNTGFSQLLNIEGAQQELQLSAVFQDMEEGLHSLSGKIHTEGDEWWLNNRPEKPKMVVESVFINPFDSYSFHTSASFRRQWLDSHLSQLDSEYKSTLSRFQKTLRFRNSLLAQRPNSNTKLQLLALDENFAQLSAFLTQRRLEWLIKLTEFVTPTFKEIFAESHDLRIDLDTKFRGWDSQRIFEHYRKTEEQDFESRHTSTGAHRDDCLFFFDGLNSFEFCSLGQQKMSFLSLLFAFIELFRYKFTFYPIVLIDDVSGELDGLRWKNLIQYLCQKSFQVLITTANENFRVELEKIPHARRIFVEHGRPVSQG